MFLGSEVLLKLVKEKKLVENLCERELKNPEGAGFDLRLGKIFRLKGNAFIGVEHRKTPEMELVMEYDENKNNKITIKPGEYYIGQTIERVNLPENIMAFFGPRITSYTSGLMIRIGQTAKPGSSSHINFAISNQGPCPVTIEMGARIIHVTFAELKGKSNLYRGQWRGDRVTTKGLEKQV